MAEVRQAVIRTELPLPLYKRGKVRDLYQVGDDRLLVISTDRISAFDVVLPTPIPEKGLVLTGLSVFWFERTARIVPNHLLSFCPHLGIPALEGHPELVGRSVLVRKARVVPLECVARGYLSGSAWKEYVSTGSVSGIRLPPGLVESERLPEPIFTPATKASEGHDENIPREEAASIVGDPGLVRRLEELTLTLYEEASAYAETRGIILADTKFEFGLVDGVLVLVDEALTPDSSRFWPAGAYRPGGPQPSFDKQYVRDWLDSSGWDRTPPAPELPSEVVARTREKYREAYSRLAGEELEAWVARAGGTQVSP